MTAYLLTNTFSGGLTVPASLPGPMHSDVKTSKIPAILNLLHN